MRVLLDYCAGMEFAQPLRSLIPGAQGTILQVLANADTPLNIRQLSDLSALSPDYVTRIVTHLVELGIVRRDEVPPSAQIQLQRGNLVADDLLRLNDHYGRVRQHLTSTLELGGLPNLASAIAYGSFATRTMTKSSDLDVLLVPTKDSGDDDIWVDAMSGWAEDASVALGNIVSVVTMTTKEIQKGSLRKGVWKHALQDRVELFGLTYRELQSL